MSSLVTYSSPWNNDDNNTNKKRTPTMRKTIKNRPVMGDADEYSTYSENFQNSQPSTIDEAQADSEARSVRVTELLNKITSSDTAAENKKLGNFQPLEPPSLNVKKDNPELISMLPPFNNKPTNDAAGTAKYAANGGAGDKYGNYMKSYDGAQLPYYSKMGIGAANMVGLSRDDKLMEKINYMIHLLEEQQHEKTSNITEEFVLYSFLGVFIIFIVDSFARSGKYTR